MSSQHPQNEQLQQLDEQMQSAVAVHPDAKQLHLDSCRQMANITGLQTLTKALKPGQTRPGEASRFMKLMKKKDWLVPDDSLLKSITAACRDVVTAAAGSVAE